MMKWLEQLQASLAPYPWAYSAIVAGVLILTAFLVNWITKRILLRGLTRILRALPSGESEEGKVRLAIISRLANIVPALVLAYGAVAIPDVHDTLETIIRNVCIAFIVLTTALALGKLLDLVEIAYRRRPDAPNKPIKGYLQLGKIVVFTVATILIVATLINRNPLILLSGLGAMAAVLMLIFQDTILSLVASLQLGSNDMVRIGDWIEMPSQNARRRCDRNRAAHRESAQLGQDDHHASGPQAHHRFVQKLARHAGNRRPPDQALFVHRSAQRPFSG